MMRLACCFLPASSTEMEPAPVVVSSREPHLMPPARFSGEPGHCRSFLTQCGIIFHLQPSSFSTKVAKVAYVISLLSGPALQWDQTQTPHCLSFSAFSGELRKIFDFASPRHDAARLLFSATQGRRSVAEFAAEFRTAATDSGWNPTALYDAFYRGLAAEVKDELAARELSSSLDDLIALATRIDRCLQERRVEHTPQRSDRHRSPPQYRRRTLPCETCTC
ncbi:nephrocystin-4-like [Silurus asotus]|uniref:Nephrocystin-4-like n=1 Tax=Silurus asotus TaxID=30991 RepID=A0AAD5A6E8_SILAS|nr:nephrocystin-4-like [Silurus asotus]